MEDTAKVFSSNITISEIGLKNNLYNLTSVTPAEPLETKKIPNDDCNFIPKTDKLYIPKRKSNRLKVKTVRDIRKLFEQDTYAFLGSDLDRQEKILLKKIRDGSSQKDTTKTIAKNILKSGAPISRSAWHMLININPGQHPYPKQFILWNGKYIQVNGSLGGKNKLICNHDLVLNKTRSEKRSFIKPIGNIKKRLLRNSLDIKFKPGPLGKKRFLDYSHQKYHVGEIALIDLPKPGLDIEPNYGTVLEPSIIYFVNNLRKEDGTIPEKWAEFAVSVLGKIENSIPVLSSKQCVTLDLKYRYDQRRILMRRDTHDLNDISEVVKSTNSPSNDKENQNVVLPEVKKIMSKMLDSVEISINQENMYTIEGKCEQLPESNFINSNLNLPLSFTMKGKCTKKKYGELERLDVTVIRLPESTEKDMSKTCNKLFCRLGCVCDSIGGTYNLRPHCGRIECMFHCQCDFTILKNADSIDTGRCGLLPALANLDNSINIKLAKEEQKFHQTVIVTGDKRILLKSEKRNWKASKKYAEFYSKMCLKNYDKIKQEFSINLLKMNFNNIEPWCMVHNLYKCFCKGKFTESCTSVLHETCIKESCVMDDMPKKDSDINPIENISKKSMIDESLDKTHDYKIRKNRFHRQNLKTINCDKKLHNQQTVTSTSESSDSIDYLDNSNESTCARLVVYKGRKFSDGYYKHINLKIHEMEINDKSLQNKMVTILNNYTMKDQSEVRNKNESTAVINNATKSIISKTREQAVESLIIERNSTEKTSSIVKDTVAGFFNKEEHLLDFKFLDGITSQSDESSDLNSKQNKLFSESKLVSWLVSNYQKYKQRVDQGLVKSILLPPENGKVALHAWDFILSRYRERKNIFLISKQKPFRIFMAVNTNNHFFENCININEIRFADLHKYPQTVKNLLTNATELKESFCVLRGLPYSWELIGMVSKMKDEDKEPDFDTEAPTDENFSTSQNDAEQSDNVTKDIISANEGEKQIQSESYESSKWFVMTIENDFNEIRFYRKGFFVRHESIVKAINVARVSGKTVRLSSTKCVDKSNSPQFGIYAIPYTNERCVFVGPYELEDDLGIESIKNLFAVDKFKKTRGSWIKTNKFDNDRVINNPLSFISKKNESKETELLQTNLLPNYQSTNEDSSPEKSNSPSSELKPTPTKVAKPIKISKNSGLNYRILTDSVLRKIVQQPNSTSNNLKVIRQYHGVKKLTVPITKTDPGISNASCENSTISFPVKKTLCGVTSDTFAVKEKYDGEDLSINTDNETSILKSPETSCDASAEITKSQDSASEVFEGSTKYTNKRAKISNRNQTICDVSPEHKLPDVFTKQKENMGQNKHVEAEKIILNSQETFDALSGIKISNVITVKERGECQNTNTNIVTIILEPTETNAASEVNVEKEGENKCNVKPENKSPEVCTMQNENKGQTKHVEGETLILHSQKTFDALSEIKISNVFTVQERGEGKNKNTDTGTIILEPTEINTAIESDKTINEGPFLLSAQETVCSRELQINTFDNSVRKVCDNQSETNTTKTLPIKSNEISPDEGHEIKTPEVLSAPRESENQNMKNKANVIESLTLNPEATICDAPAFKISEIFFVQEGNCQNKKLETGTFILKPQEAVSDIAPNIKISEIIFVQDENKTPVEISHCDENEIKITEIYSLPKEQSDNVSRFSPMEENSDSKISQAQKEKTEAQTEVPERGMFILKPEEINRKLLQNKLYKEKTMPNEDISKIIVNFANSCDEILVSQSDVTDVFDHESYQRLFNSSAHSSRQNLSCDNSTQNIDDRTPNIFDEISNTNTSTNDDTSNDSDVISCQSDLFTSANYSDIEVFIISDDENDTISDEDADKIWLQCKNVDIGWVSGKRNSQKLLSFKLRGREYSEFCTEEEALNLLNIQIIGQDPQQAETQTQKLPIPKKPLEWTIVESASELKGNEININNIRHRILGALEFLVSGKKPTALLGDDKKYVRVPANAFRAIRPVIIALNHPVILKKYIRFPKKDTEREILKAKFYEKFKLPGVIGCVDSDLVPLVQRKVLVGTKYYCGNGYSARNALIINDHDLNIMYVDTAYGGAMHKSAIFEKSTIKPYLEQLNAEGETAYLLGDSTFPLRTYMMVPCSDPKPGSLEAYYNELHASAWSTAGRTFSVLKNRFKCLLGQKLRFVTEDLVASIFMACCVLHNICNSAGLPAIELPENLRIEDEKQMHTLKKKLVSVVHEDIDNVHDGRLARERLINELRGT